MIKEIRIFFQIYKYYQKLKGAESMQKTIEFLKGKKTYLVAIGLGIVAFLQAMKYIDETTAESMIAFLTGSGLAALRASK
jgi:hypothetical protein